MRRPGANAAVEVPVATADDSATACLPSTSIRQPLPPNAAISTRRSPVQPIIVAAGAVVVAGPSSGMSAPVVTSTIRTWGAFLTCAR